MSDVILADLRRLYHHLVHGGVWNSEIDTRRLGKAIEEIERLESSLNRQGRVVNDLRHRIAKLEAELEDCGHIPLSMYRAYTGVED